MDLEYFFFKYAIKFSCFQMQRNGEYIDEHRRYSPNDRWGIHENNCYEKVRQGSQSCHVL